MARYFVRVKPDQLERFKEEKGLSDLSEREIEDEFVFQNSVRLNDEFYSSLGEKRAFVMSHARNLIIMKIVGYAEACVEYYRMPDVRAHVWIAHQRYPTKGRVSHESPMGKALLGHAVNDTVVVRAPAGEIRFRIKEIS